MNWSIIIYNIAALAIEFKVLTIEIGTITLELVAFAGNFVMTVCSTGQDRGKCKLLLAYVHPCLYEAISKGIPFQRRKFGCTPDSITSVNSELKL